MTTAAEDGVWNTESYVSTGLTDEAVEAALNPYAVQGVEFSYLRDADCTQKITEWAETDEDLKFSVSYADGADGADGAEVMTIAMTASGLAEINGSATVYGSDSIYSGYSECYVRITYTATVNSDASVVYGDTGNPNDVTLEWRRTNTSYYDTLKDCCHLYTYGLQLNKRFSDNAGDYSEVTFTIRNATDSYWLKAELAEDGLYYVTDHVATEAEATSFVPNSDSGVLTVWGLEDDAYTVTETHTAQGYTLLRDSIEIVITARESDAICEICGAALLTASATVNGNAVTMLENNGSVNAQVPFSVINTKGPDLPVTGDDGVWKYGVISILLMTGSTIAIILVLKGKKEPKSKR